MKKLFCMFTSMIIMILCIPIYCGAETDMIGRELGECKIIYRDTIEVESDAETKGCINIEVCDSGQIFLEIYVIKPSVDNRCYVGTFYNCITFNSSFYNYNKSDSMIWYGSRVFPTYENDTTQLSVSNTTTEKNRLILEPISFIQLELKEEYIGMPNELIVGNKTINIDTLNSEIMPKEYIEALEEQNAELSSENQSLKAKVLELEEKLASIPKPGDLNCDGVIDVLDQIILLRYLAGTITELPYIVDKE